MIATFGGVLELISQSDLKLPSCIEHAMVSASRHAKCAAGRIAVDSAKHMAIECIGNIQFKADVLAFGDVRALYDRKILIDVAGTANIAEGHRQVTENETLLGNEAG